MNSTFTLICVSAVSGEISALRGTGTSVPSGYVDASYIALAIVPDIPVHSNHCGAVCDWTKLSLCHLPSQERLLHYQQERPPEWREILRRL